MGSQAGHGLVNWTNEPDHSRAEYAVPVEREKRTRNAKYLFVVTSKIAAAAVSPDRPSLFEEKAVQLIG